MDSQEAGSLIQDPGWEVRPAWMGKSYSIDLRKRVQAEIESSGSRRAAARRYDVSPSFAVKLADRILRTGSAEPARQGRPPGGGKLAPYLATLLEWVDADPDITMPELAAKLGSCPRWWCRRPMIGPPERPPRVRRWRAGQRPAR